MAESNITSSILPISKPEDCGEVYQNAEDGCTVSSKNPEFSADIVFPEGYSGIDNMPLAGGAVIKISYPNYKPSSDFTSEEILSIFAEDLNDINLIEDNGNLLSVLTKARITVNGILNKIGGKTALRKKIQLPQVFITTYLGDDSDFVNKKTQAVAGIFKVCEFNYIPLEIIEEIIFRLFQIETLANAFGVSGVSFSNLGNADIFKQVLEIFPIFNISSNEIAKRGLTTSVGGYYTFDETTETIYLKMPDLSGKNSFGESIDLFTDRNFYIEIHPNNILYRIKLEDYSYPPNISFTEDFPTEFPETGNLEIIVESNKSLSSGYLSVIAKNSSIKVDGIDTFTDGFELYTVPLLTKSNFLFGEPTFNLSNNAETYLSSTKNILNGIFDTSTITANDMNDIGLASTLNIASLNLFIYGNSYFGEKNRPEVVLLDSSKENPSNKNDNKYSSSKMMEARELFANVRPKIYKNSQIPYFWIKTQNIFKNLNGNYVFSFSSSDLNLILKDKVSNLDFVFYAMDSDGQLARAPRVINLTLEKPYLSEVDPNGFDKSPEISPFRKGRFTFKGENLISVTKLTFFDSNDSPAAVFYKDDSSNGSMTVNNTSISLSTNDELQALGLISDSTYYVIAETGYGKTSNFIKIYVSDGEGNQIEQVNTEKPDLSESNEFLFLENGTKTIYEIPVCFESNATVKIISKSKFFSGDYELYAYLATDNKNSDSLKYIDLESNLINLTLDKELTIASGLQFDFSESIFKSDFYKISNKKAGIRIPGNFLSNYNLNALVGLAHNFYIVITPYTALDLQNKATITSADYYILQVGDTDNNKKAFINGPNIYGFAAVLPDSSDGISSTVINKEDFENIYINLGVKNNFKVEHLNVFKKISKLAIIFYNDGNINNNRFDFYIGNNKINSKLSGKIEVVGNKCIAYFDNIKISEQGDLPIYIVKNYKDFDVKISSESVYKTATFLINSSDFSFDSDKQIITTNNLVDKITADTNSGLISSGRVTESDKVLDIFPATGSGISYKIQDNKVSFLNDIDLTSNFDLTLSSEGNLLPLLSNIKKTDISSIDISTVYIPIATQISSQNFIADDYVVPTEALAYLQLKVDNPNLISFNKPDILSIKKGLNVIGKDGDPNKVKIVGGEDYTIVVKSPDKDFVLLFDKLFVIKPKNVKKTKNQDEWVAIFRAPKKLIGSACPEICASVVNSDRTKAKFQLGTKFVVDAQSKMASIIDGQIKKKIPDFNKLKELIEDFPLRFASIKLDKVSIPTDLINSFCDMSFHLTADLKIALNGFQILMTPIQIIFCIIDVICALINPPKLAKAVIRLFQCLYDLVLLLPMISIPVMFLQLILHLLKLLECVFEKVLTIITVINEVINAISLAVKGEIWDAIKSLEEVLSEYLLDLEVSLSVLDPIVSILAIFLQLLGLVFRFPCSITDEQDEFFCMDGSMLGGLIVGKILNSDQTYKFDNLIPVGQSYSEKTIDAAIIDGTSDPLIDPADSDSCATQTDDTTYLDSMNVDVNSLRSTFAGTPTEDAKFNLTFAASATKSRKGFGSPYIVEFQFKERGRNGFFNKKKIIDPDQTLDCPIYLTKGTENSLKIETGNGKNFVSPIDEATFITITDDKASVKPLVLDISIPITEINAETGLKEIVGSEIVTRTFDNIPKMAIIDDEFNVYFIEEEGIEFDNDGLVSKIRAKVINSMKASKLKFIKEDVEIDTDLDGEEDDEAPVYDFPQLFFFDMRAVAEDIETKCGFNFFNNDLLDNNPDAIAQIVTNTQECLLTYQTFISQTTSVIREDMVAGKIPAPIDLTAIHKQEDSLTNCLNESIDDICVYVVNSLNSQFKILDDTITNTSEEFPLTNVSNELSDDFEIDGLTMTGANEFAAGIGDSADIEVGNFATIQITPRDSYDNTLTGDFSEKINVEIISDTTGSATFIKENNSTITKDGDDYFVKITANNMGIVKVKATVCDKTIQTVTYSEIKNQVIDSVEQTVVDCIPDANTTSGNSQEQSLGALTKVDRILTIFFEKSHTIATIIANNNDAGATPITDPQAFGSKLEN